MPAVNSGTGESEIETKELKSAIRVALGNLPVHRASINVMRTIATLLRRIACDQPILSLEQEMYILHGITLVYVQKSRSFFRAVERSWKAMLGLNAKKTERLLAQLDALEQRSSQLAANASNEQDSPSLRSDENGNYILPTLGIDLQSSPVAAAPNPPITAQVDPEFIDRRSHYDFGGVDVNEEPLSELYSVMLTQIDYSQVVHDSAYALSLDMADPLEEIPVGDSVNEVLEALQLTEEESEAALTPLPPPLSTDASEQVAEWASPPGLELVHYNKRNESSERNVGSTESVGSETRIERGNQYSDMELERYADMNSSDDDDDAASALPHKQSVYDNDIHIIDCLPELEEFARSLADRARQRVRRPRTRLEPKPTINLDHLKIPTWTDTDIFNSFHAELDRVWEPPANEAEMEDQTNEVVDANGIELPNEVAITVNTVEASEITTIEQTGNVVEGRTGSAVAEAEAGPVNNDEETHAHGMSTSEEGDGPGNSPFFMESGGNGVDNTGGDLTMNLTAEIPSIDNIMRNDEEEAGTSIRAPHAAGHDNTNDSPNEANTQWEPMDDLSVLFGFDDSADSPLENSSMLFQQWVDQILKCNSRISYAELWNHEKPEQLRDLQAGDFFREVLLLAELEPSIHVYQSTTKIHEPIWISREGQMQENLQSIAPWYELFTAKAAAS